MAGAGRPGVRAAVGRPLPLRDSVSRGRHAELSRGRFSLGPHAERRRSESGSEAAGWLRAADRRSVRAATPAGRQSVVASVWRSQRQSADHRGAGRGGRRSALSISEWDTARTHGVRWRAARASSLAPAWRLLGAFWPVHEFHERRNIGRIAQRSRSRFRITLRSTHLNHDAFHDVSRQWHASNPASADVYSWAYIARESASREMAAP